MSQNEDQSSALYVDILAVASNICDASDGAPLSNLEDCILCVKNNESDILESSRYARRADLDLPLDAQ